MSNIASTTNAAEVKIAEAPAFYFANVLMNQVADRELYEEESEPRPSAAAIATASLALAQLDEKFREAYEIEPFWGQLSLVWRSDQGKRVKATFGGNGAFSVYHEQLRQGRVIDSQLETLSSDPISYLKERLAWL